MGNGDDGRPIPESGRARGLRWVALAIVAALALAYGAFLAAEWLRLAAFFAVPRPGVFAVTAADMRFTRDEYAEFEARTRSLSGWATASTCVSLGLVATAMVATAWCARQTWSDVKHWHWLSFVGLTCLLMVGFLGNRISIRQPAMLGLLALDAVAFACAAIDLRRRRYGTPGRIVAWATGVLSVGIGALAWSDALGPNGIIGRWLRL